jgi:hypothetical protein
MMVAFRLFNGEILEYDLHAAFRWGARKYADVRCRAPAVSAIADMADADEVPFT